MPRLFYFVLTYLGAMVATMNLIAMFPLNMEYRGSWVKFSIAVVMAVYGSWLATRRDRE